MNTRPHCYGPGEADDPNFWEPCQTEGCSEYADVGDDYCAECLRKQRAEEVQ